MLLPLPISDKRPLSAVQPSPRAPKRQTRIRLPRLEDPDKDMPFMWLPPAKIVRAPPKPSIPTLCLAFATNMSKEAEQVAAEWLPHDDLVDAAGMKSGPRSVAKNSDENTEPNNNGAVGGSGNAPNDSDQQDKSDGDALRNNEGAAGDGDGDEGGNESAEGQGTAASEPDEPLCQTPVASPRPLKCPSRPNRGMPIRPHHDSDDELSISELALLRGFSRESSMMGEDDDDVHEMQEDENFNMDVEEQGDPYASPPATPRDMQNAPGAPRLPGKV